MSDRTIYWSEEVDEAMEILRSRRGSTALLDEVIDDMERVLKDALCGRRSAPLPVAVPDGFVLVPRNPTEKMLRKFLGNVDIHACAKSYNAMLAAAPPPPMSQPPDAGGVVELVTQCRDALSEEMDAYDIDPPIAHVKDAHDACVAFLTTNQKVPK